MEPTKDTESTEAHVNGNGANRPADLTDINDVLNLIEQATAQVNYWSGRLEVLKALRVQLAERVA